MANKNQTSTDMPPVRFRPSPDTVAQRLGDEMVLIHMKTDRIFVLNRTGARLWELLCATHERAEIQQRLLQEFDVTDAELPAQIDDLLTALKNESLITPDDESE